MNLRLRTCVVACLLAAHAAGADHMQLKRDEQIVFYPSPARYLPDGACEIHVRGCVFEWESRWLALRTLKKALGLLDFEMSPAEEQVFRERARLFLVDHESRKHVVIQLGDTNLFVGVTDRQGWFEAALKTTSLKVEPGLRDGAEICFRAALASDDTRVFTGSCFLLWAQGLSVVSDIDDTIRITGMDDPRTMLRNTFLRAFQPVPGMARLFQELARSNNAVFHYVSATPWQLYPVLAEFIRSNGFPPGTFHLQRFSWRMESFATLVAGPEKHKLAVIGALLREFPQRQFLLIGDSGERDPEIYGELARLYPGQVVGIWIRDVTGVLPEGSRYRDAFQGLPSSRWRIFRDPDELRPIRILAD